MIVIFFIKFWKHNMTFCFKGVHYLFRYAYNIVFQEHYSVCFKNIMFREHMQY